LNINEFIVLSDSTNVIENFSMSNIQYILSSFEELKRDTLENYIIANKAKDKLPKN